MQNNPPNTNYPIPLGEPESMDRFPPGFMLTLEENDQLYDCCRKKENLTGQYYESCPEREGSPDLFVAICTCGRRHRRVFAEGAHIASSLR